MRGLIHNGGTSFLIGLLFGGYHRLQRADLCGAFAGHQFRSREAEQDADSFSIRIMHRLGRPTKPMGELLVRVTGKEQGPVDPLQPPPERRSSGADDARGRARRARRRC